MWRCRVPGNLRAFVGRYPAQHRQDTNVLPSLGRRWLADYPAPRDGVNWAGLGFSLTTRETRMIMATCGEGQTWERVWVEPYGPLSLEPSATIINYGQGLFEGIKAFRTATGRIVIFRPQKNARRLADGARRFLMPPIPSPLFMEACSLAVKENAEWVPPCGEGALYIRPVLFGSGADLGVKPSNEYTFCIYVAPVGQYFGPDSKGARMHLCSDTNRAAPAGVGHIKCVGNYAQCFAAQRDAKSEGFSDIIYLDCSGTYIEEAAASNFFCIDNDNVVHTPKLGMILPGVTRDTIIQLVRQMGEDVQLRVGQVSAETALGAKEVFLSGTGAGIIPVENISTDEESYDFPCPGPVTSRLQKALKDAQEERVADTNGWLFDPWTDTYQSIDSVLEPA